MEESEPAPCTSRLRLRRSSRSRIARSRCDATIVDDDDVVVVRGGSKEGYAVRSSPRSLRPARRFDVVDRVDVSPSRESRSRHVRLGDEAGVAIVVVVWHSAQ